MSSDALFPTPEAAYEALQKMDACATKLDDCAPLDSSLVGVVRVAGVTKYIVLPFSSVGIVSHNYAEGAAKQLVDKLRDILLEAGKELTP